MLTFVMRGPRRKHSSRAGMAEPSRAPVLAFAPNSQAHLTGDALRRSVAGKKQRVSAITKMQVV